MIAIITNYYGTVVKGSSELETSIAEQEILPNGLRFANFEITNDQICTISINGGDYIYLRANQGLSIPVCNSCKIKENDITYNWTGIVL